MITLVEIIHTRIAKYSICSDFSFFLCPFVDQFYATNCSVEYTYLDALSIYQCTVLQFTEMKGATISFTMYDI